MGKLFNLEDLQKEASEQPAASGILRDNFLDSHLAKVESLKQLNGRLPEESEIYFLWTINSFNAFTFIPYLIKNSGVIQELTISSYSVSSRILNTMLHYLEKQKITRVHFMLSDSIKFRLPKVREQLDSLCMMRAEQFTVDYKWNHSKICLAKTDQGCFVFEGSGNFAENAQFEQYIFLRSEKVYNFRKEAINGI